MIAAFIAATAFCVLFLLPSCKPREYITSQITQKDSVRVEYKVEYKDTSVTVEADSSAIMALVECPDLEPIILDNTRMRLEVKIKDGKLQADCLCKEKVIAFKNKVVTMLTDKFHSLDKQQQRVIIETRMPTVGKIFMWIGIVCVVALLAYGIYRLYRFYKLLKPF